MIRYMLLLSAALALASAEASVPNVMLFYESLCPYCKQELSQEVPKAVQKFGGDVFFSLVPFGNAKLTIGRNGKLDVKCQHGDNECTGNIWHACSHLYMEPKERLNYAICTMGRNGDILTILKECTTTAKATQLEKCANSSQGVAAVKLMADITYTAGAVVNPKGKRRLDGVPTIFIDGFPISNDDQSKYSLSELICLKALNKPKQCS